MKETILRKLSQKNFYARLKEDVSGKMKESILKYGLEKFTFSVKKKSFYHGMWQNRYLLKDLLYVSETLNVDLPVLYDSISAIFFRTGKQRGQNSLPMQLPQNFNDFFYLAGLFVGDGSHKKFIAGKKSLAEEVERICTTLGMHVKHASRSDRTPEVHVCQ